MSVKIMGQVWDLDLTHAQQTVLLAMADHADHDGAGVYPSLGLLAWKTSYSRRQVQRIIHEAIARGDKGDGLVAKGILVSVGGGGDHRPNEWQIVVEGASAKEPWDDVKEREQDERRERRELKKPRAKEARGGRTN